MMAEKYVVEKHPGKYPYKLIGNVFNGVSVAYMFISVPKILLDVLETSEFVIGSHPPWGKKQWQNLTPRQVDSLLLRRKTHTKRKNRTFCIYLGGKSVSDRHVGVLRRRNA